MQITPAILQQPLVTIEDPATGALLRWNPKDDCFEVTGHLEYCRDTLVYFPTEASIDALQRRFGFDPRLMMKEGN